MSKFKYIAIIMSVLVLASCNRESEKELNEDNVQTGDSLAIGDCVYANQYGEIKLLADTDSSWRFQINSGGMLRLDTVLYTYGPLSFDRIISDKEIPGHNLELPFILAPYQGVGHQHSISFLEHVVVDYNYIMIKSSPIISAQNYGWIGNSADLQTVAYLEKFYRLGDNVTISDNIQNLKGGPKMGSVFIESALPKEVGPPQECYYHANGAMTLEEFPEGFYSTEESPQGMFSEGEKHFRLVMRNCDFVFPKPFVYAGTALNSGDGKACIAWDFADSEIYQLDGKSEWDPEEIGQRITVHGHYTYDSSAGSVIRNWSIIPNEPEPKQDYRGFTINVNNEGCIVWEFARSEAYILKDHGPWPENELDAHITVNGSLLQDSTGSYLTDWKILN